MLPSGFTKALFLGCIFPLWHRCFPLDFTGALFFAPFETLLSFLCLDFVGICGLFACFCAHLTFNISFSCCRHNVSNIFVQLTEERSARDQPKQPPAKKNNYLPEEMSGSKCLSGYYSSQKASVTFNERSTLTQQVGQYTPNLEYKMNSGSETGSNTVQKQDFFEHPRNAPFKPNCVWKCSGKSHGKGIAPATVFAPPANPSPRGRPQDFSSHLI